MFSCNGRGQSMFGACDHDATMIERRPGRHPAAGFFAAGEIGPVGGRSFLHTFTATWPSSRSSLPAAWPRLRRACARIALADATVLLTGANGGIGRRSRGRWRSAARADPDRVAASPSCWSALARAAGRPDAGRRSGRRARDVDAARRPRRWRPASTCWWPTPALPATGELTELTAAEIDRMLDVNLRAPIALARALAPSMIAAAAATWCSSPRCRAGRLARLSMYSATKFGMRASPWACARICARTGVGVPLVVPGLHPRRGMFADTGRGRSRRASGTRSPSRRRGRGARARSSAIPPSSTSPRCRLRIGAAIGSVIPGPAARASRLMGLTDRRRDAERQRYKR